MQDGIIKYYKIKYNTKMRCNWAYYYPIYLSTNTIVNTETILHMRESWNYIAQKKIKCKAYDSNRRTPMVIFFDILLEELRHHDPELHTYFNERYRTLVNLVSCTVQLLLSLLDIPYEVYSVQTYYHGYTDMYVYI